MSILDAIVKNPEVVGDVAKFAADNPQIAKAAMDLISSAGDSDGLGGILEKMQSGGLGEVVSSWLSGGDNLAVSPDKVHSALGPDLLENFSKKAGVNSTEASSLLAGLLPQIVDKLSPDGQLPDNNNLDNLLSGLMGSLKH